MENWHPDPNANVAVFSCAERPFTVADVIRAADFRGELDPQWERLLCSLRCEAKAHDLGMELDDDALQLISEQFRQERDLITAEETEQWLTRHGMTVEEFSAYFVRRFWETRFSDEVMAAMPDAAAEDAALQHLLRVDLVMSGACDAMAMRLGERVAAKEVSGSETLEPGLMADERGRFMDCHQLDESAIAPWLATHGFDQREFDDMLRLEGTFRRYCHALLTDEIIGREIASHRIELTRADLEMIELDSRDAAHEALLCARKDDEPLHNIARRGGYPWRRSRPLLAELPDEWRQGILSAAPGAMLDPLPRGDGFQLCRLIAKVEPSLDDAEIRSARLAASASCRGVCREATVE